MRPHASPLIGFYDDRLVVLSVVIAILAAYAALDLADTGRLYVCVPLRAMGKRCVRRAFAALAMVGLALGAAQAQVAVVASPTNVGATSTLQQVTLTITAAGTTNATLGTAIQVVTQGVPGLDFNYLSGGSCATLTAYTVSQTCTVNYSFSPMAPGLRRGAVELFTASGTVPIAVAYISGVGLGPLASFTPGTISTVAGSGNYTYGSGSPTAATSANLRQPTAVVVDPAGNMFISDWAHRVIRKVNASTQILSTIVGTSLPCTNPTASPACGNGGAATSATWQILRASLWMARAICTLRMTQTTQSAG